MGQCSAGEGTCTGCGCDKQGDTADHAVAPTVPSRVDAPEGKVVGFTTMLDAADIPEAASPYSVPSIAPFTRRSDDPFCRSPASLPNASSPVMAASSAEQNSRRSNNSQIIAMQVKQPLPQDSPEKSIATGFKKTGDVFLPRMFKDVEVIVEGKLPDSWKVVKAIEDDFHGVAFRRSKCTEDRMGGGAIAEWDESLDGSDDGEGWLRCNFLGGQDIRCPRGHQMCEIVLDTTGHCDSCQKALDIGHYVLECKPCDWFRCERCCQDVSVHAHARRAHKKAALRRLSASSR